MKIKLSKMIEDKKELSNLKEDMQNIQIQVSLITQFIKSKIMHESNQAIENIILNSDYEYTIDEQGKPTVIIK